MKFNQIMSVIAILIYFFDSFYVGKLINEQHYGSAASNFMNGLLLLTILMTLK